ncbi:MAG: hypothetical protein EA001_14885 [Oscillatoriales cyanobacterium]|nr:MAG: hypothetical protein EA001_14885 [Oscillatoriales cyanobacterium]
MAILRSEILRFESWDSGADRFGNESGLRLANRSGSESGDVKRSGQPQKTAPISKNFLPLIYPISTPPLFLKE